MAAAPTLAARTRRFASPFPLTDPKVEPIHQPLYSAAALDAAALPNRLRFFTYQLGQPVSGAGAGVVNSTKWHTNMEATGQLANPKLMLVTGVRIMLSQVNALGTGLLDNSYTTIAENNDQDDDFKLLWYGGDFVFHVGTKDYMEGPLPFFPGNTGLEGYAAIAASGIGPAAGLLSLFRKESIYPSGKYFSLPQYSILIPPLQSFYAEIHWQQATPATMIDTHLLWVVLDGVFSRESQ